VADHDERGVGAHGGGHLLGGDARGGVYLDPAQREAELLGDAGRDVPVGREVVAVEHDLAAPGAGGDGRAHRLVEQHGRRVADDGLARRGTEADPAQLVPDGLRQVEPAFVPAPDQPFAPLLLDEAGEPFAGDSQRTAQRVAVEVHEVARAADEAVTQAGQEVVAVELLGCGHAFSSGIVRHAMSTAAGNGKSDTPRTALRDHPSGGFR
jgi:hypothetical protein